ncbi:hypothetical protein K439DRAFT_1618777 [Ramaria rubella]|nr:hypothetical protein K439DRAFT_1618777 [Ramaria rubella]
MPRNVATRWNSTYCMLVFALEYQKAVKALTGDVKLGLDGFELSAQEWRIADQLCDILQVHHTVQVALRSIVCIAMVLHPCHKLAYFKAANWEPEWIKVARKIVHKKYNHSYGRTATAEPKNKLASTAVNTNQTRRVNIFDTLPTLTAPWPSELWDELNHYLSTDPEQVEDVLQW